MAHPQSGLYIPFEQYDWLGGPATFMRNLRTYLDQRHYRYSTPTKQAKVVFFPNTFELAKLERIRRHGGYIIQRLDGIRYLSKHGDAYREQNREVEAVYRQYADMVVFQSQYSLKQCFAMFGARDNYQIIVNGVDTSIFYPNPTRTPQNVLKFITTGNFRNRDMLEPVVQALDMLAAAMSFELTVIGPVVNSDLEPDLQRPYLRHIPTLTLPELAEELRQSDLFLYSHLNTPCPNSVVEAISCGLPVVGFDSGAMAELCFFSKDLLAYVSDDLFQKYEDFDFRKLAEKIEAAVEHYSHYRQIALSHSSEYSFDACGRQYMKIFETYLRKHRKIIPYATHLFARGMLQTHRPIQRLRACFMKQAGEKTDASLQKLPATNGDSDELKSSRNEADSIALKDVLVLTYPKSFWASPESHIFPNRCEMRWKWGHSSLWRNAVIFFFQALVAIWRVRPKILYFGAAGRVISIFIWLKKRGCFRDMKFIATNHMFFKKHDVQFLDRIIVYTHSDIIGRPAKYHVRYCFIPLPADGDFRSIEGHDGNYIFSGGGEGRDFKSLIESVVGMPYRLKIVSFSRALLEYPGELPENVEFHGFMPLPDYLGMIANAICVVIPLKYGNHPHGHTSIIQAFSLGKAVITTKDASCEDYAQDRINALLVAPGDIAGYRTAIQELCENTQLRHTLAQRARQDAEQRFTYRHFAEKVVALCEELLSTSCHRIA